MRTVRHGKSNNHIWNFTLAERQKGKLDRHIEFIWNLTLPERQKGKLDRHIEFNYLPTNVQLPVR